MKLKQLVAQFMLLADFLVLFSLLRPCKAKEP
jgi:hypothetical protein